jgi:hypothetical protein
MKEELYIVSYVVQIPGTPEEIGPPWALKQSLGAPFGIAACKTRTYPAMKSVKAVSAS